MDWPTFTTASHEHEINLSEFGDEVNNELVWTSTSPEGQTVEPDCAGWTSKALEEAGIVGSSGFADGQWTEFSVESCSYEFHLYCVQTAMPGEFSS